MASRRLDTWLSLSAAATEASKREMNHGKEYWYIGSMTERSEMAKNRMAV